MPENILFDLIAPMYDRLISAPDPEKIISLLDLPTNGALLDAGGGTGRMASNLHPHVDEIVLSDLSFSMLREARSKPISGIVQASSHCLPFPNEYFDRILVVDAMHHFDHQGEVIKDLLRVLKPDGRLLIEEPDIRKFRAKIIWVMEKLLMMKSVFYSPEEIKAMVEENGGSAYIEEDELFTAWVVAEKRA
jgi:demethylmenaquinone methyltransferase/2-methoxy-6-polyprenyl-1,4-benzoquinol methylase